MTRSTPRPPRLRGFLRIAIAVTLFALGLPAAGGALSGSMAHATTLNPPRVISSDQVNLRPSFNDGQWELMLQPGTDSGVSAPPPVSLNDSVIQVGESAMVIIPDAQEYSFLGLEPGSNAWALEPLGLGKEAPSLGLTATGHDIRSSVKNDVTFSLTGYQGPGDLTVYNTRGPKGVARAVWDSRAAMPQPHHISTEDTQELSWVFSAAGYYLVQITVSGTLLDGSEFSDARIMRFAVGSTAPDEAVHVAWHGQASQQEFRPGVVAAHNDDSSIYPWLITGLILTFIALLGAAIYVYVKRHNPSSEPLPGDDE